MDAQQFSFNRRRFVEAAGLAGLSLGLPSLSSASSPIRLILPVSAGSGVDVIARAASGQMGQSLGGPVVVENMPGAGGVVGTQTLVRSSPDGLTLGLVSNNHVIYPAVLKSLPFDPVADITPISTLVTTPLVLVTRPGLPAKDLKEFQALLKANPGKYNYGSAGNGTILHLAAELFKEVSGTFSTHIPYRGTGPLITDVLGGQIDWAVIALPAIKGAVDTGKMQALAVASSQRVASAPNIPTAAEQGFPKYVVEGWVAVVGPKGMSSENVTRIHAAVSKAYQTAEVKDAMAKQGNTIVLSSPEETTAHIKSELTRYAAIVKRAGVTPQ